LALPPLTRLRVVQTTAIWPATIRRESPPQRVREVIAASIGNSHTFSRHKNPATGPALGGFAATAAQ